MLETLIQFVIAWCLSCQYQNFGNLASFVQFWDWILLWNKKDRIQDKEVLKNYLKKHKEQLLLRVDMPMSPCDTRVLGCIETPSWYLIQKTSIFWESLVRWLWQIVSGLMLGQELRQGCGADRRRPKFTWYTSSTSSDFKGRIRPEIVSIVTSF